MSGESANPAQSLVVCRIGQSPGFGTALAILSSVPVVAESSSHSYRPISHGSLRVSVTNRPPRAPSDVYAAVVDQANELAVALLSARGEGSRPVALAQEALGITKVALERRAPMYEIVSALRSLSASERPCHLGAVILRFSQPECRVEILNAGMPPVARVLPSGELHLHPALSLGIGERFGEVHPYELAKLCWGSTWLVASEGLTVGDRSAEGVRELWDAFEIGARAEALALASGDEISLAVQGFFDRDPPARSGALLAVHADPTPRFHSGIWP